MPGDTDNLSELAREALMWLVRLHRRFGSDSGAFDLDISGASTHRPTDELPHDPMYQALQELEQRGLVRIEADKFMVQTWTFAVYLTDQGHRAGRLVYRRALPHPLAPQHLTLRETDVLAVGNGIPRSCRQSQKTSPPHRAA